MENTEKIVYEKVNEYIEKNPQFILFGLGCKSKEEQNIIVLHLQNKNNFEQTTYEIDILKG